MNTTIYFRPRQSGKTTDLVRRLKELHPNDEVLFLVASSTMRDCLYYEHPELRTYLKVKVSSYHPRAIEMTLKGFKPEVLIIDNGEWIEHKAIVQLRKIMKGVKEFYISGTEQELIQFKVPNLLFEAGD